jgi:predicted nucleic acid-binding protein
MGTLVVVPAVVIAETTRGGPRDAPVNRVLTTVDEITPVTEATARLAGRLLAAAGLPNATIDALVVAEAALGDAAILLTSDLKDLSALAAGYPRVHVYGV